MIINTSIFGISIEIKTNDKEILDFFLPFFSPISHPVKITLTIEFCSIIKPPTGTVLFNEKNLWVIQNATPCSFLTIYQYDDQLNQISSLLTVDSTREKGSIMLFRKSCNYKTFLPLLDVLLRTVILLYDGILIHASTINWQGKGIVFSAPSETGKTTQANLWTKFKNAEILNDDHSPLRILNSTVLVYETPWNKLSKKKSYEFIPLKTIILLEQAKINSLRKLTKAEIITKLLPRCFLPYFDEHLMNIALCNFQQILKLTPIYLLRCKPDLEAVNMVYQCVR